MADMAALIGLAESPPLLELDVAIKAYKAKMLRDLDIYRKMQNIQFWISEQKAVQEFLSLEFAKTSNWLQQEYGFDLEDLNWNVNKLKLKEQEEIKSFEKMFEL